MKIWTITYNDDSGSPNCAIFNTEEEAEDAAREWIDGYRREYHHIDFDRPWRDVFEKLCDQLGFMDSITIQGHDVPPTEPTDAIEKEYVRAAQNIYRDDGVCEIDDNAVVSISEYGGAYVQAWVWVYFSAIDHPMAIIEEERRQG